MPDWKRTLYIMFTAQLLSAVGFSMIFPFLPKYVEALGSSYGLDIVFLAGAVFSAQALTMAIASPVWGALADSFGRKLMVQRALFGGAVLLLAMAFATSAEMLVALRALQGFVTGTVAAANALVAASAPRERTGYAMGFLQVGTWSGVALGPLLGGVLADAYGYNVAFYFTSGLLFVGGLLVLFFVKDSPAPLAGKRVKMVAEWRHVFATPGVNLVFFFRFMTWLSRNILIPYLPLFIALLLVDTSHANTLTGAVIAAASAAGTVAAIVLGRLGDRVGHRVIVLACSSAAALGFIPQIWVTAVWQLLALQALTGAAVGGVMPSLAALLNHYTSPGEEGAVYGLDNSVISASRAVAPMIGALVVYVGGFRALFLVAALLLGITALLAYFKLPDPTKLPRVEVASGDSFS